MYTYAIHIWSYLCKAVYFVTTVPCHDFKRYKSTKYLIVVCCLTLFIQVRLSYTHHIGIALMRVGLFLYAQQT